MSLPTIRDALEERGDARQAIAYTSAATGTARIDGDLGIAIDQEHRMSGEKKPALIRTLAQVERRPFDVVDLHGAGEPLPGQVLQHGKQVLGSSTDRAELIRRHVSDSGHFMPDAGNAVRAKTAVDRDIVERKLYSVHRCLARVCGCTPASVQVLQQDIDIRDRC